MKLKISHDRLAKLHPADTADIVEELAPDEREAVFETLGEGVAAEALAAFAESARGLMLADQTDASASMRENNISSSS